MATLKKRINVSLSPEMEQILTRLAKRDHIPEATKAAALIQTALEIEEDYVLDEIARKRDTKSARFFSHKKAWK